MWSRTRAVAVTLLATSLLTACGDTNDNSSAPQSTIVTQTVATTVISTPTATSSAKEAVPPAATDSCNQSTIMRDLGLPELNYISNCDGTHAIVGVAQTSTMKLAKFVGGKWQLASDICASDVPQEIRNRFGTCGKNVVTGIPDPSGPPRSASDLRISMPECNGQGILIVHSVLASSNRDAELISALNKYPGAKFMIPGLCPSIRKSVNGQDIYPVYLEYGFDRAALCQAKARYGGNARTLNLQGDFTDPCG